MGWGGRGRREVRQGEGGSFGSKLARQIIHVIALTALVVKQNLHLWLSDCEAKLTCLTGLWFHSVVPLL